MIYLILYGTMRLLVEIIRINPRILFGLTEAQIISIIIIIFGFTGIYFIKKAKKITTHH